MVGSAEAVRADELELRQPELARRAAEELGRGLAAAGCRISVYTSDPRFIEAHVLRGYVQSGTAAPGSIEVRFSDGAEAATFPECETHAAAFRFQPDTSQDWEDTSARRMVASLLTQLRRQAEPRATRREAEAAEARRRVRDAVLVIGLFVAVMAAVTLELRGFEPGSLAMYAVVLMTPLLAGAAGATAKTVFETDPDRGATVMAALGLVAGGISAVLFLLSQLGFVAGFTFESVYRKLAGVDVVRSETVERS